MARAENTNSENDPLLEELVTAPDDETRRDAIAGIVRDVAPLIDRVLQRACGGWLRSDEISDLRSTVVLRLLRRLRDVGRCAPAIPRFGAFAAAVTNNAVNDYLRRRYPERTRLKNRLRYVMTHDPAFALWSVNDNLLCGLSDWLKPREVPPSVTITDDEFPDAAFDQTNSRPALLAIFARLHKPVLLDDLIDLLEVLWRVRETKTPTARHLEEVAPNVVSRLETRSSLESLWREVRLLPSAQQTALLLNLRDSDGGNALGLIVLLGIATFDEIAEAAGLTSERLAAIREALPLGDLSIASVLDVDRQQVINLRKSARRRLLRRMK